MTDQALGRARLVAQGLVTRPYARPADAVAAFGAMQGQDLSGVLASACLRSTGAVADVLADLDAGRIVRAYPMRETVFLLPAADARWISELINPPMIAQAIKRRGALGLDDARVDRSREVLLAALAEAPRGLTRAEIFALWEADGMPCEKGVGYHVLKHVLSEVHVVYGPWNGTDQSVVLASGWLPSGSGLEDRFNGDRQAAIIELLRRYVLTHGPVSVKDFAWWTKLAQRDIKPALAGLAGKLETDGERWWRPGLLDDVAALRGRLRTPRLLPAFDEFILGYQDRLFAMTPEQHELLVPGNNGVFLKSVVVDGLVRGFWKRSGPAGRRRLDVSPFAPLSATVERGLARAFTKFPAVTP